MPKKRVGVSLRKPSPAPESPSELVGVESSELPRPEHINTFVSGAAAAIEKAAGALPPAELEEVRRGPEGYRELTVYLPEALAERLKAFCLEQNLDLSRVIAAALDRYLSPRMAKRALGITARRLLMDLAGWVRAALAARSAAATHAAATAPS
jgi:hypothetical protein